MLPRKDFYVNKILEIQMPFLGIARSSPDRCPLIAQSLPTHRPLNAHLVGHSSTTPAYLQISFGISPCIFRLPMVTFMVTFDELAVFAMT
jgi:hypothetical protein